MRSERIRPKVFGCGHKCQQGCEVCYCGKSFCDNSERRCWSSHLASGECKGFEAVCDALRDLVGRAEESNRQARILLEKDSLCSANSLQEQSSL
jgi:hypothetical protein